MLSTPAAMPVLMLPERMDAAMFATACSPDEHCRFTVYSGTDAGKPARSMDMRAGPA